MKNNTYIHDIDTITTIPFDNIRLIDFKKMINDSRLHFIEHIQVLDEPLVSLYESNKDYYMSIRLYENKEHKSYIILRTTIKQILNYMNGNIGLRELIKNNQSYYYEDNGNNNLSILKLSTLTKEEALKMLIEDGSLDDKFDSYLSYRSVNLKNYLKNEQRIL